jgi:hypothetical protein
MTRQRPDPDHPDHGTGRHGEHHDLTQQHRDHDHDEPSHSLLERLAHLVRPHSHDAADSVDDALKAYS